MTMKRNLKMNFDAELIAPRRNQMINAGLWLDKTIIDSLQTAYEQCPNKTALVSFKFEKNIEKQFTYQELWDLSHKVALGLQSLGIGKDDVISCQLPNWWEFTILYLACCRIGAVINPLMPIFRENELTFMLKHSEAKMLIVPKVFRKFNHEQLAYKLKSEIETLEHIIVVDGDDENSFDQKLIKHGLEKKFNRIEKIESRADDITQLIFTSGTTGEPKGVMHSSNTLYSNIIPYAERMELMEDDVILMPSPMAHQTGFMYGLIMPIELKAKVVLQDVWDTAKAVELIEAQQVSFTMASTPFLNDLSCYIIESQKKNSIDTLKTFLCAGAPIPQSLVQKAYEALQVKIISAWGMTECGAVTTTMLSDHEERAYNTDGIALKGMEVKVVDEQGQRVTANISGNLMVRACSNFGGYLKRPHLNSTDLDGWLDTGDIAVQDDQGYIRICGRKKDLIIRGGENIPVAEIESLLYQHPNISIVALVPYPDARLGERACAVIKLNNINEQLTVQDIVKFLQDRKVALQYIPEFLEIVDEMPMTPSGKIQKFKLKKMLEEQRLEKI